MNSVLEFLQTTVPHKSETRMACSMRNNPQIFQKIAACRRIFPLSVEPSIKPYPHTVTRVVSVQSDVYSILELSLIYQTGRLHHVETQTLNKNIF